MNSFKKDDTNKLRYDLLPFAALDDVARNFTHGLKYGERNWEKATPDDIKRLQAALYRHASKAMQGERMDEDSGVLHWSAVATNALMLAWHEMQGTKEEPVVWREMDENAEPVKSEHAPPMLIVADEKFCQMMDGEPFSCILGRDDILQDTLVHIYRAGREMSAACKVFTWNERTREAWFVRTPEDGGPTLVATPHDESRILHGDGTAVCTSIGRADISLGDTVPVLLRAHHKVVIARVTGLKGRDETTSFTVEALS